MMLNKCVLSILFLYVSELLQMNFTLLLVVTFLCLPEVTQAFVRRPRAFKSYNFERLPYKRSRAAYEDEAIGASAENRRQLHSWNQGYVWLQIIVVVCCSQACAVPFDEQCKT